MQRPQGILAVRITFDYSVEYEHCCMACAWQHQIGKSSTSEDTHSSSCATKVSSLPYRNRKKIIILVNDYGLVPLTSSPTRGIAGV